MQHFARTPGLAQGGQGLGQEQGALLGQLHAMAITLEQLRAHILFQCPYLRAQGRLDDVQALGRAAKVQFFGDGDKGAQVFEFHGPLLVW